jgi:hypothetical protein
MLRGHLEFRVEIEYEDGIVSSVYVMGRDGHPKIDVLYCMTDLEIVQAAYAAEEARALQQSRREAMEEDRNRE